MERGTKTQEKQKLGGLKIAFENGGPILHIFENRGVKSIFKSKMYYQSKVYEVVEMRRLGWSGGAEMVMEEDTLCLGEGSFSEVLFFVG